MLKSAASAEDASIHNSPNFRKQKRQEKSVDSKMCYSQFQQRSNINSWNQIELLSFLPKFTPKKVILKRKQGLVCLTLFLYEKYKTWGNTLSQVSSHLLLFFFLLNSPEPSNVFRARVEMAVMAFRASGGTGCMSHCSPSEKRLQTGSQAYRRICFGPRELFGNSH